MKETYDFSAAKPNPYAKRLKKQVTIRIDQATLEYFRDLSGELGIPYQTLMNLYLGDCVRTGRRPSMEWQPTG